MMKKTILKSSLTVLGGNALFLAVAVFRSFTFIRDIPMLAILIFIAIALQPTYFFIKTDDENNGIYALTAVITEAIILSVGYLIIVSLGDSRTVDPLIFYFAGAFSLFSLVPPLMIDLRMAAKRKG